MAVVRFYSNEGVKGRGLQRAAKLYPELSITTELCYNVELTGERVTASMKEDANAVDSKVNVQMPDIYVMKPSEFSLFQFIPFPLSFLPALCCRL